MYIQSEQPICVLGTNLESCIFYLWVHVKILYGLKISFFIFLKLFVWLNVIYMFPKYSETLSMRLRGAETKWNSAGDWSMNIFTQTSSKDFDYLHNFQKTLRVGFNNSIAFSICTMQEVQMSICMHTKMWILFPQVNKLQAKCPERVWTHRQRSKRNTPCEGEQHIRWQKIQVCHRFT